jgi:hypothetical protein
MGRYLKNTSTRVGYALRLPTATDAGPEPSNLIDGLIRYNSQRDRVQFTFNGVWKDMALIGNTNILLQDEIGDGVITNFVMDNPVADAKSILVFIGGVFQEPNVNYTIVGNAISFATAPPPPSLPSSPNKIVILYNFNSTDAV